MECAHCGTLIEKGHNLPCDICGKNMHVDCRNYHIREHAGVGGGRGGYVPSVIR